MEQPQTWPALLQLPEDANTGPVAEAVDPANGLNISTAPLLYTGDDRPTADALMAALFARQQSLGEPSFGICSAMLAYM